MMQKSIMDSLGEALGDLTKDIREQASQQQRVSPSSVQPRNPPAPPPPAVTATESPPASPKVGRPLDGDKPMTPAERAKKSASRRAAEDKAIWQSMRLGFADNKALARLLLRAMSRPSDADARDKASAIVAELSRRLAGATS